MVLSQVGDEEETAMSVNIRADRAHGGKPEHIDMTTVLPNIGQYGGADKVEVDYKGMILPKGSCTQVGKQTLPWIQKK